MQGNTPPRHFVDKTCNGCFIIICCERSREPQPERPGRRQGRATSQRSVTFENLFWRGTIDDEILQRFAGDAELNPLHFFGCHLKRNLFRLIDENPVTTIGYIERSVLVRLLAAGATVFIPNIYDLSILDK